MTGRPSTARPWLRAALTLVLGVLNACGPTLSPEELGEATPRSLSVKVETAPVRLRASREYRNPNTWTDGERTLDAPLAFTLPASLRVTQGNAGNHKAELWYRDGAGNTVNCDYRGGSDEPHPEGDSQRELGQRYVFERCDNGARAGDAASAIWFKLHVRGGDQKDPAGLTEVELKLGGTGDLEPPLSPPDSIQIRDAFSWERTQPVAETNAEGHPALYSALIYVEDRDHLWALDELLIHHEGLPLFAEELERWNGQKGFFRHEWDGKGLFRFGLVPGAIYNRLRAAALEGNVVFRAVVLRDVPASARGADGSISYAALRASGFLYRNEGPAPTVETSTGPRTIRQELFGAALRLVVKAIGAVAVGVVDGVRQGIGELDREANGSVELTVDLEVLNVDPAFTVGTPMVRAWGPGMGQPVRLPGVKVLARQRGLGPFSTLFTARTGPDGVARLKVVKGLKTSLCVALESPAAKLSYYLTEIEFCDFAPEQADTDRSVRLALQQRHFNILALASEGYQYMHDVVHVTPHQAFVLVGPLARPFGIFTGAAVPCFGLPNLIFEGVADLVFAQACSLAGIVGGPQTTAGCLALYSVYTDVDIVFAETADDEISVSPTHGSPAGTYNRVMDSRLVPSHEYGHFALCTILNKHDPATFMSAYAGAMLSRMDFEPDETNEAGYLNEGFADFFTSQVAGGTTYFDSPRDLSAWEELTLNYCADAFSRENQHYRPRSCLDRNYGAAVHDSNPNEPHDSYAFEHQVARVASTFHDAFDSWQQPLELPTSDQPGNGNPWIPVEGNPNQLRFNERGGTDEQDEVVRLRGIDIYSLLSGLEGFDQLSNRSIMGQLSKLAQQNGYSWCDRCKLFALNDKGLGKIERISERRVFDTPQMEARCKEAPIRDWIGPRPASEDNVSCDTVAIAGRVFRNGNPVTDVQVRLMVNGYVRYTRNTDTTGAFRFDGLEAAKTYQLRASQFIDQTVYFASLNVTTGAGVVSNVALALKPVNDTSDDGESCYIGEREGYYCHCLGQCTLNEGTCEHLCRRE